MEPRPLPLTSVSHSSCVRYRGGGQGNLITCRQGTAPTHTCVDQSAAVLVSLAGVQTQRHSFDCEHKHARLCVRPAPVSLRRYTLFLWPSLACSCRPCASLSCISNSSASWLMPCCGSDGSSHQASSTTPGRTKAAKLSMCPLVSSSLYKPLLSSQQHTTRSSQKAVSNKQHSQGTQPRAEGQAQQYLAWTWAKHHSRLHQEA